MNKLKKLIRYILNIISILLSYALLIKNKDITILMYHKIGGNSGLELDLPLAIFERHLIYLKKMNKVISFDDAISKLENPDDIHESYVVISFDDGYDDFFYDIFPLLQKYNLPAILYVTTDFINNSRNLPISDLTVESDNFKPLSWEMLRTLSASDLITIGSHTHNHYELTGLDDADVIYQVTECDRILKEKLNVLTKHFAYPRGIYNDRVEKILMDKYETICIASGGGIFKNEYIPYRIKRTPVFNSDGWFWFKFRVAGYLDLGESLIRYVLTRARGVKAKYFR